jgi:Ca-activated chloride channel homolog
MFFRRSVRLILFLTMCVVGLAFQSASRQGPLKIPSRGTIPIDASAEVPAESRNHLRVDTSLVLIPAHVTDTIGKTVIGLTRENFQIKEDGVDQSISYFAREDAPVSVGLLFDASGSMQDKKQTALEAASRFFSTSNPEDEFFLVEFNEKPKLSVPFTGEEEQLYDRMKGVRPFGRTSLYDAIYMGLTELRNARNDRKALVIFSDGGDNRSRHSFLEVRNKLLESDVQVYAMGIFNEDDMKKASQEEREGPKRLEELASASGGRLHLVKNLADLPEISLLVSNELRDQYLIGYAPINTSRDGKYRRVKLKLDMPEAAKMHVGYRQGYYAPKE